MSARSQVGLRDNLFGMLSCYNPLWLRLALEAVSGEMLAPGHTPDDAVALRRFADRRVLSAQGGAVCEVTAGCHPEEKLRKMKAAEVHGAHKLIVRRVLSIVVLLDAAKREAVMPSDPCLFCVEVRTALPTVIWHPPLIKNRLAFASQASIKSSREMALEFNKNFLSGSIGDLAKHIGLLGELSPLLGPCRIEQPLSTLAQSKPLMQAHRYCTSRNRCTNTTFMCRRGRISQHSHTERG